MVSRVFRGTGILLLCGLSAFFILLCSWLPKGGIYPYVSKKIWGPGLLWCAGAKLRVSGLENIRGLSNAVLIANHQSLFDIPSITAALPIPVYFIAKKELKKIPIFGWGMASIGMVFVDRNNRDAAMKSMKKASKQIAKGKFILTFPEGTRSKDGEIQTFKKGSFHLAKNGPLRLIPIAISGSRDILPPGGKLQSGLVKVHIGAPITEETVGEKSIAELSKLAHLKIAEMVSQLEGEKEHREARDSVTH
ncbi:MAG: lysophospholipid acyltransferase family protein [Cryomorphaceae bacterium]|nr:1-acyl-sn-glycerol-3-phosphate acyltransferase [Flavobacteriales bacterium]